MQGCAFLRMPFIIFRAFLPVLGGYARCLYVVGFCTAVSGGPRVRVVKEGLPGTEDYRGLPGFE